MKYADLPKRLVIIAVGSVVAGVLLGGSFGACTIITVVLSGPIIQLVNDRTKRLFGL